MVLGWSRDGFRIILRLFSDYSSIFEGPHHDFFEKSEFPERTTWRSHLRGVWGGVAPPARATEKMPRISQDVRTIHQQISKFEPCPPPKIDVLGPSWLSKTASSSEPLLGHLFWRLRESSWGPFFRILRRLGSQNGHKLEGKMEPKPIKNRSETIWNFKAFMNSK